MPENEVTFEPVNEAETLPALKEPGTNVLAQDTFTWQNAE